MIYNLSMFKRIIIVVTVNYDVIGFYETGSLERSGRTVFEIVSPTDDFETIKMGYPSCQIVTVISLSISFSYDQVLHFHIF